VSLAAVAHTIPKPIHGLPCSVGRLLTTLDAEDVAWLAASLADDDWTDGMIYQVLTADNWTVGRQSIGRHRRGDCRCFA
jgi:hypothetical protein